MQTRRKRERRSGLQGADNADELMFRLTASSGDQESHRGLGLAVRCGEVVTNPGLTHPFSMHCIPLTEVSLHHQQERQKGWSWVGVGAQEMTTSKDTRGRLHLSHDDKRSPMNRAPVCLSQWHLQGLERCLMNVPNEWTHGWSALGRESSAPIVFTGQKTANIKRC